MADRTASSVIPALLLQLPSSLLSSSCRFLLPLALRRSAIRGIATGRQLPLAHAAGWVPQPLDVPRAALVRRVLGSLAHPFVKRCPPPQTCCKCMQHLVRLEGGQVQRCSSAAVTACHCRQLHSMSMELPSTHEACSNVCAAYHNKHAAAQSSCRQATSRSHLLLLATTRAPTSRQS
jgi:hypothetical protein